MSSRTSHRAPGVATGRQKRTEVTRLCATLFGATPLAPPCSTWAGENPRFAAFLDSYQGKIGKKRRGITDDNGYFDLLAELEVAHRLLTERAFTLIYEPFLAERQRGPDFGVTYKTHTSFMVEVRHLRPSTGTIDQRLVTVLAEKLRQLPASTPNILAMKSDIEGISTEGLQTALNTLAALAQRRDDDACKQRGFANARDLLRRMERLSAVAVLAPAAMLYEHPRARHTLPPDLRKTLARALG